MGSSHGSINKQLARQTFLQSYGLGFCLCRKQIPNKCGLFFYFYFFKASVATCSPFFYPQSDSLGLLGIVSWGDVRTKQTDGLLQDEASRERGDRQIWTSRNTLQPDTVQTQGTHALKWYDTPAGRTCKAVHILAFGSTDKCASVISSRSLCSTVVMPPSSAAAFDVWRTCAGKQKDEIFLDY